MPNYGEKQLIHKMFMPDMTWGLTPDMTIWVYIGPTYDPEFRPGRFHFGPCLHAFMQIAGHGDVAETARMSDLVRQLQYLNFKAPSVVHKTTWPNSNAVGPRHRVTMALVRQSPHDVPPGTRIVSFSEEPLRSAWTSLAREHTYPDFPAGGYRWDEPQDKFGMLPNTIESFQGRINKAFFKPTYEDVVKGSDCWSFDVAHKKAHKAWLDRQARKQAGSSQGQSGSQAGGSQAHFPRAPLVHPAASPDSPAAPVLWCI